MILKKQDIIVVGLQAWDTEIGSNCKNIAIEFAKHNRVLYVNYPLDRKTISSEKDNPAYKERLEIIRNKKEKITQVENNIWVLSPACVLESINWIPSTKLFRYLNKINNKRFAGDIQRAIEKLQFKNFVLFNDSDMFRSFHLKELLKPSISIYYTRDNLMGVPYWYKHGHQMEPELFAKSDLVVANSTYLADVPAKHNKHSYYVGQGCEVDDFDIGKIDRVPADIASIKAPIIGYIGALYKLRLDVELLEELASQKKEWSFVFIGPEDEAFKASKLHQLQNVFFLGLKEGKELPYYLASFDVAINPQKVNEVTIGNYPRKIDEYLAMGKPVVATETVAMSIFSDYVYFGSNAKEYAIQIEKALQEDTQEKRTERIAFARSHTWENSVKDIYAAMHKVKPQLFQPAFSDDKTLAPL